MTKGLMQKKIKTLQEIQEVLEKERREGRRIVQCHGVFDLLHPGHIRHLNEAREQGDRLVVTLTPDRFVNKGPGRPAFNENLRSETLAALACVDYVVLNETPDAVHCIKKIKPSVYVKGVEYKDHANDVTGKISDESQAVEEAGGQVHYTDDIVFSSSSLLNKYFDPVSPEISEFITQLKKSFNESEIIQAIHSLTDLNVLVIGDAIIDEYQYVAPLGQSGKGLHMTARLLDKETFLGGSLIVANHVAQFAGSVTLLTSIGKNCSYLPFINQEIDPKVQAQFIELEDASTLVKKRYVLKDGKNLSKLFETYSTNDSLLNEPQTQSVNHFLQERAKEYDLVIACDFGNGFTNPQIVQAISCVPTFLAVNTQTNSGNRGFNVVTHYKRADFISLNEPELRLAAHDRNSSVASIVEKIAKQLSCKTISVTRGVGGVLSFENGTLPLKVPALTTNIVDRIGAGDSYLAIASLCLAKGCPLLLAGFLGSTAAALDIQIVGNKEPVKKAPLCKFVTRLLK